MSQRLMPTLIDNGCTFHTPLINLFSGVDVDRLLSLCIHKKTLYVFIDFLENNAIEITHNKYIPENKI